MKNTAKFLALLVLLVPLAAHAVPITIDSTDSGWYNDAGLHNPVNTNYIAGLCSNCGGPVFRNFFVFDLSGISGVTSATLRLDTATVETAGLYSLWDVVTDVSTLVTGGTGLTGIYDDLGMGAAFGEIFIDADQDDQIIDIVLSSAAISSINASPGGLWALGGSYDSTLSAFFASFGSNLTRQLIVDNEPTSVPEPNTIALVGLGLVALRFTRRKLHK